MTPYFAATRNPLCSNLHFSLQELDHWWTLISLLWTTRPSHRMSHCPPPYESDFSPKWTCLVLSLRKSKEGWFMWNQRVARPMLDFQKSEILKVSNLRPIPRLKFEMPMEHFSFIKATKVIPESIYFTFLWNLYYFYIFVFISFWLQLRD